eukprot:8426186-Pyramimonas_sp.AAC.1
MATDGADDDDDDDNDDEGERDDDDDGDSMITICPSFLCHSVTCIASSSCSHNRASYNKGRW